MKRLLILALCMWGIALAQTPPSNYTDLNSRYQWLGGAFKSLTIPAYGDTALIASQWRKAGAVLVDTTGSNKGVYVWYDNKWNVVGGGGVAVNLYTANGILQSNRTLTGNNGTYSMLWDSLAGITHRVYAVGNSGEWDMQPGTTTETQGIGGTYKGVRTIDPAGNNYLSSDAAGNNIAGFVSASAPTTLFGSTRRFWQTYLYTYLNATKWQYMGIDSNRAKIIADTTEITGPLLGRKMVLGIPGTTPRTSANYILQMSANNGTYGDGKSVGVFYLSSPFPSNKVAFSFGTITQHGMGIFTNDGNYQASFDTTKGMTIGEGYAPNGGHVYAPVNGLVVQGEVRLDTAVRMNDLPSGDTTTYKPLGIDASGYLGRVTPGWPAGSGSSGTNNANVGSGYRVLKPATQELKTLFAGYGVTADSTTNTDGLTFKIDTTTIWPTLRGTLNFNAIAGSITASQVTPGTNGYSFIADNSAATWDLTRGSKYGFYYWNDFFSPVATQNDGNGIVANNSSGTTTNSQMIASNHPGEVSMATGTGATNAARIISSTTSFTFGGGATSMELGVTSTAAVSDGTNSYQILVGFLDAATVNQTDGLYFLYDTQGATTGSAASANWQIVAASNGTRTFTTTSTAYAINTYNKLRIEVNAAGTSAAFYIDGTLVGTLTTNIPTGTARSFGFGASIIKSAGTTARNMTVDYLEVKQLFTTPR